MRAPTFSISTRQTPTVSSLSTTSTTGPSRAPAPTNLVVNGDFESARGINPWLAPESQRVSHATNSPGRRAQSGTRWAELTSDGRMPTPISQNLAATLDADRAYNMSLWFMPSGSGAGMFGTCMITVTVAGASVGMFPLTSGPGASWRNGQGVFFAHETITNPLLDISLSCPFVNRVDPPKVGVDNVVFLAA